MARDNASSPDKELWQEVDVFVKRFEEAWQNGGRPAIDDFLLKDGPDRLRQAVLCELVEVDLERRLQAGEPARREDYLKRYPQLAINPTQDFECPQQKPVSAGPAAPPQQISRYRVTRVLGRGGFGIVYLAHDDQLQRFVAIKVPHRELIARPEDAKPYLTEARTVAGLDHPHIVPVYDVGSTPEHPFFVVSKFIEGGTLAQRIKENRPSVLEATELVSVVAETLHYAHKKGLVHRDIKPGNILLECQGTRDEGRGAKSGRSDSPLVPRPPPLTPHPLVPFVADFGLALRDKDYGKGTGIAGTPAYLSPEQARGEGHRVDGRSDIFSLGVVFYELLTGMRPFQAGTLKGLLEQIRNVDVRPPRQRDDTLPRELERICLKALARRASERYTTAKDFADDLRHFLVEASDEDKLALSIPPAGTSSPAAAPTPVSGPATPSSPSRPIKIVPKGLRSFDSHDADFFLELLPEPRDRDGLPNSIRFWKTKIEEMDADNTFGVGLIYGPSGSGKSSLVKAGLLPRLHKDIVEVYVEATALETETRVLNGLRKLCPTLSANLGLKEALATLRRGQGIPPGKKVLIVLDQFEQWLHANKEQENTELVEALRQCDGSRVQCIVMVRDDFWLAVSRFLKELEVRLFEGENSALVDLFDLDHAKKVLAAFGRAFGKLSDNPEETSKEHKQFLEQSITGLAQEGKVICVRLALFAEMMKGKTWTPASLKAMGGTSGVGVTFLEETFSVATAPPEHRYHQKAARGVLRALAPESGTDIKGHMRSYQELLEESGYGKHQKDFDDLLRILDSEIRLITPTDPEGRDDSSLEVQAGAKYYQLTHDYLVHSVRDWLTRKQKETWRGRAELLLADRATMWNACQENRQLPSLLQWFQIKWLTQKKYSTPLQRKMMQKATRYHTTRGFLAICCLILLGFVAWDGYGRLKAHALRDRLLEAITPDVTGVVKDMAPYRWWIDPLLYEACAQDEIRNDPRKQLHVSLGLLPVDSGQVTYLYNRLLNAQPQEVFVIRDALADHQQDLTEHCWKLLENPRNHQEQRFRAACALAAFASADARWEKANTDVAEMLVVQKPFLIAQWTDALKGVGKWLIPPLADFLVDERRSVSERGLIASIYNTYAAELPGAYTQLEKRLDDHTEPDASAEAKVALAKRQASIGVALAIMGREARVWPLLKHQPDPTLRSFLIERLGPGGVDSKLLTARLDQERDVSTRRAILLSLGEFGLDHLSRAERQNLLPGLLQWYRDEPDRGIHGAVEWLLGRWEAQNELNATGKGLATGKMEGKRQWYVSRQGHTMMIVPRPGMFWMGEGKERHQHEINRSYAIAARAVTVEQFLQFRKNHPVIRHDAPSGDCPVNNVSWYEAAEYCNWLSEKEGFPKNQWCYLRNQEDKFEAGMKMAPNYLQLTGYRLPTEAEWEYACRAGAETAFSFGAASDILDKYGWYKGNSSAKAHPVGMKKPNDWGLSDMHGNATVWTQGAFRDYLRAADGQAMDDIESVADMNRIDNTRSRVLRGGSFSDPVEKVHSGFRERQMPAIPFSHVGFRLARTIPAAQH